MKNLTLIFLLLSVFGLQAQKSHNWCLTDHLVEEETQSASDYAQGLQEAAKIIQQQIQQNESSKTKQQGLVYTIPVVFHVIYANHKDNISRLQIEDGLRVINEDFRRLNADRINTRNIFQGVAADAEIEFKLAKIDPNGNCTDGITRTQSHLSIDARDNVKHLVHWDNKKYFNVWVVNSINDQGNQGTVLGYAYLPSTNQTYVHDGMVIRHDQLGTIGTSTSTGRTFTHEAGHYLGLKHPFGSNNSCSQGDGIGDTPPVASPNFGCNQSTNSCNNDSPDLPDMIENYMDYADGSCQNIFTQGQVSVMRATLQSASLRLNLRSNNNHIATGLSNPPACTPTAIFKTEKRVVCQGEPVKFTDLSEDGTPTSWNWTFNGGTPSSSTSQSPTVIYNSPGIYDVSLTVGNSAGSGTTTYNGYIHVTNFPGPYYANWSEDFESNTSVPYDMTAIDDGDGINFEITQQAASSGTQSLLLNNFNSSVFGERDEIISPAINTIFTSNLTMSFDYAFAAKHVDNSDELNVYASTDCGETWILRRFYRGGQLRTGAVNSSTAFVPTASEWTTQTISFDAYIGADPLLVKFEFTNGGGNNFYLDNINFSGTVGAEEFVHNKVQVFPNPAVDHISVSSNDIHLDGVEWSIVDINGKLISKDVFSSGQNPVEIPLPESRYPDGLYFIRLSKGDETTVHKLSIIRN